MGVTLSSVHIYSTEPIADVAGFYAFSDGWQTFIPSQMPEDLFELRKLSKNVSKKTDAPVLWFYIFDDEAIWFEIYQAGKRVCAYSSQGLTGSKNLYGLPALIGYDDGQKRRLSRILSCADIDYQVELLEEYFGVCLLINPELMDEPLECFRRVRSDEKYQMLLAEDRKTSGNRAPIKAELVFEEKGKLFERRFADPPNTFKPHLFYYGYHSRVSVVQNGNLKPVRLENGKLISISQKEFDEAASVLRSDARKDERITEEYYPIYKVSFTEKAPEGLRGKTLTTPRGYYYYCFDEKGRVILSDEKGGLMIVDDTLSVVAKLRIKGDPVDYADGYILTAGSRSFYAYCYDPGSAIRIYKLIDVG